MSNVFYESLGRVTWAVGKRQVRRKLTPSKSHKKAYSALVVLAVGAVVAGGMMARASATHN